MEQSKTIPRENIIDSANVTFHNVANPRLIPILDDPEEKEQKPDAFTYDFNLFPEDHDMKFGILELKIADTPMLTEHQFLDTSNDISGSMSDYCKDGKSKMQHVMHTLKNIVTAIVKSEGASVTMATYGFDNKIEEIFTDTQIASDNESELRAKMDQLQPRNGTDLYQALECQANRAAKRRDINSNALQTNITLTDGQANEGKSTKYSEMAKQVAPNCTNIFIGFGADHNAIGLQQLADAQPNGSYFYVAEIEKAGLVFGEVIHQMLYTALVNITIEVQNAEIYDYKTNTWQTTLQIPSIVSEAKKTYHLRSTTPNTTYINIYAQSLIHGDQGPSILDLDYLNKRDRPEESVDLTTHMFRQRTQELLYTAHKHNTDAQDAYGNDWTREQYDTHNESSKTIRKDLVDFCKFMQQYAKENSLEDDDLLGAVIADLTVVAKTFGGPRAVLYTASKCNSQGRQTSNNTNYIYPNDLYVRRQPARHRLIRRQNALSAFQCDINQEEDDELGDLPTTPQMLRGLTRTYTTPRQMTLMRSLTGEQEISDLDEIAEGTVGIAEGTVGIAKGTDGITLKTPVPGLFPPIIPSEAEGTMLNL
ncbi:MAG: VWA domain-containing protein [Alphaproteobacteria bacterium]|uniref:VWFA domain-containing protein n=1 Tax=viral metagenome TaxID=1070528 RepID=A0A6C0HS99_9ZZZZ|nr:VWA domain-containing protein [Alphaproteobacteria bacterium]